MELISLLQNRGLKLKIQDPFVPDYQGDVYQLAQNSDLLLLGVNHNQYRELDLKRLAEQMRTPLMLDTRNFFSRSEAEQAGFTYHLLGQA